jgi:hypothetical protein
LGSESGVEELADEDSSDNENKCSSEEAEAATANSVIEKTLKKTKVLPDIDENSEQPVLNKEGSQKRLRILGRKQTLSTIKKKNLSKNKKISLKSLVPGKEGSLILKSR